MTEQTQTKTPVTFLVTQGWGSNPKIWVRAVAGHRDVPAKADSDVGWGWQVFEADVPSADVPLTAFLKVPTGSALPVARVRDDCPDTKMRGQKMTWPAMDGLPALGLYSRRAYRRMDAALGLLAAAWRDCGYDVKVVDHRDSGGGFF